MSESSAENLTPKQRIEYQISEELFGRVVRLAAKLDLTLTDCYTRGATLLRFCDETLAERRSHGKDDHAILGLMDRSVDETDLEIDVADLVSLIETDRQFYTDADDIITTSATVVESTKFDFELYAQTQGYIDIGPVFTDVALAFCNAYDQIGGN